METPNPRPSRTELLALANQVVDKVTGIGLWESFDALFMSMQNLEEGGTECQVLLDALGWPEGSISHRVEDFVREHGSDEARTAFEHLKAEARANEDMAYLVGLAMGLRLGGRVSAGELVEA